MKGRYRRFNIQRLRGPKGEREIYGEVKIKK